MMGLGFKLYQTSIKEMNFVSIILVFTIEHNYRRGVSNSFSPEDVAPRLHMNSKLRLRCVSVSFPVVLSPCRCSAARLSSLLSAFLSFFAFVPRPSPLPHPQASFPHHSPPTSLSPPPPPCGCLSLAHFRHSIPANARSIHGNSGRRTRREGAAFRSDLI